MRTARLPQIIVSNGRPKVWYFTSGKERCIKRKNRANMTNATITEALAGRPKTAKGSGGGGNPSGGHSTSNIHTTSSGGYVSAALQPGDSLLGVWGAPQTSPQRQQSQLQRQQSQQLAQPLGHKSDKQQLDQTEGGRNTDGTSTGTTLGPWPHHGVVARFQGSITMPHNGGGAANRGASLGRKKKGVSTEEATGGCKKVPAGGGGRGEAALP
jgi:hypothetical protein